MRQSDLAATDLRGFLHYVPIFRGRTFVIDVAWEKLATASQAEFVLDLCALQSIGVRLVVVSSSEELESLIDWVVEHEFRSSVLDAASEVSEIARVLERGQAAMLPRTGEIISEKLMQMSALLEAAKTIVVNDFALKNNAGEVLRFLTIEEASSSPYKLSKEHQRLLNMAVNTCRAGVERVHLLDGTGEPGVVLKELFSNEGVGTMVYGGLYRQIRMLREEDISELLGLIGRSVRRTQLVPRTYEEVLESLDDYAVVEVDGNVLGSVALYTYEDEGEIACLYVKKTHEGTGYGKDLVEFMEQRALSMGMKRVFALTNSASQFFESHLGYQSIALEEIPKKRRDALAESGRNSLAYAKDL